MRAHTHARTHARTHTHTQEGSEERSVVAWLESSLEDLGLIPRNYSDP